MDKHAAQTRRHLLKLTTQKRIFFSRRGDPIIGGVGDNFSLCPTRPLVIHASPAPSVAFILIVPGIFFQREFAVLVLTKCSEHIRVAIERRGEERRGEERVGSLETQGLRGRNERCEVRQIRVPYFPESRGLPKGVGCRWRRRWKQPVGSGCRWWRRRWMDLVMRRHVSAGFVVVTFYRGWETR